MSWRAPWLRERLLLLSLALWDLLVVWAMYALIYRLRLGEAPGITLALVSLELFWLGGSYLLGRYTQRRRGWASWQRTALHSRATPKIFAETHLMRAGSKRYRAKVAKIQGWKNIAVENSPLLGINPKCGD